MSNFYIVTDALRDGPFTLEQLKAQPITPHTLIDHSGLAQPIPAADLLELRNHFQANPSNVQSPSPHDIPLQAQGPFTGNFKNVVDLRGKKDTQPGEGTITISPEMVLIVIKRHRSFRLPKTTEITIPRERVIDVIWSGSDVSFGIAGLSIDARTTFRAASVEVAMLIESALPKTKSAAFLELARQQTGFAGMLNRATPRISITPALVALNIAAFIATAIGGVGIIEPKAGQLLRWGADFWPLTTSGQWWRLLTSTFLHFGVVHLAFNMWALINIGPLTERLFGRRFFLLGYIFSGLFASLASQWFYRNSISVGASGAIFGVYGMLLAYMIFQRSSVPPLILKPILKSTLVFVGYNVLWSFRPGIDAAAHFGGLLGGLGIGLVLSRPLDLDVRAARFARQLILGVGVAAISLAAIIYLLPKCDIVSERAFLEQRRQFDQQEHVLIPLLGAFIHDFNAHNLNDAEFTQRLQTQLIPGYEGLIKNITAVQLPATSSSKPLQTALVQYCTLRRNSFLAFKDFLSNGKGTTLGRYENLSRQADELAPKIAEAAKRAYME